MTVTKGAEIKNFLLQHLRELKYRLGDRSWSQEGEDRILLRFFNGRRNGFYVDIGAHHPFRFSNTYLLYKHGWRGINIDAMPGSMALFKRHRTRDQNLEIGVSGEPGMAKFFVFNERALNTFDEAIAQQHMIGNLKIEAIIDMPTRPLKDILGDCLVEGQRIDLMSIDVEGRDLSVLQSNDWLRFRPEVILVESFAADYASLRNDECFKLLNELGYTMFAKTVYTVFYRDGHCS